VRILPDKPSLDFLRKEAKDLLSALRESSPETSLTNAQQMLAADYGMRDWAELKSEVERRAAEAPVPPDGLADALAAAFDLGGVLGTAPVAFTLSGRCWSITTDRGRWLAVTVFSWITEAQAEIGARLRDAAVAAGVAAPTFVRSPRGRLLETVQGHSWRVHQWIEVGPPPVTPAPAAVARRAGAIFGTLHTLAIPSRTPVGSHLTSRRSDDEWDELLDRARAAGKPWAQQLEETLPMVLDLRTIDAEFDSEKLILCNRVLNPENVRMGHNDELVVTDWDFAGSLTPELELGWALTQWTRQPSINHQAITALRDGYVSAADHWPKLELASFAVAVSGWLNWTYDRICDATSTVDNDRLAYAEGEISDLLKRPMTRSSLQEILGAVDNTDPLVPSK